MISIQRSDSPRKPPWHVDRWIWQQCSSGGALLLFLIPIVLAVLASNLFPQIATHVRLDPIGYQERLSAIQVHFKNWTPFLEAIGAFHIRDTLWFRLLLALLAFVLFVSLGKETAKWTTPTTVCKPQGFYRSPDTVSVFASLPRDQIVEAVQETLKNHTRRIRREEQENKVYLYGERSGWAKAGTTAVYLGLLFLIAGLAANGRWGWQQANVRVPSNESVSIGPEGNHQIQLGSIRTEPAEVLEIQINGSRSFFIRWGAQGRHGSFRHEWVSKGGPLVQVHAQGADGEKLTLYNYESRPMPVNALQFAFTPQAPQQEADRLFIVADTKVVGRLVWLNKNAANGEKPRFYLWTFGEDRRTPLADQEFAASESSASGDTLVAQIGDVTYVLDVARYVIVNVAYQPGFWAFWIGGILLVGGGLVSLIPRWQTWALIAAQQGGYEVRIREQSHMQIWQRWRHREMSFAELQTHLSSARIKSTQDQANGSKS